MTGGHAPLERYAVAAIQFEPEFGEKEENIRRLLGLVDEAARQGARLIVTPEMATTGYCWYDREEIRPHVEPIPGPTTERFAQVARERGCYVVVGMPEVASETGIFYNSAALVGPAGLVGVYRKTHSYISEPKWAKDGDLGLPVWHTPLGRLGILICMDADYFEPARLLALQGADVLCFPTNWLEEKSPSAAWMARAFENGCYLIAANRYGCERGVQFSGGSAVLDPDGSIQAMLDTGDGVVLGEVSLARAREKSFRPGGPPDKLHARRPDLYDTLTLNAYLWNPLRFHGLYGHRPLPPGRRSTVAVAQLAPAPGDPVANLRAIAGVIEGLPAEVELVVFPEYALTGPPAFREQARRWALADCSGPVAELIDLAARRRLHIVAGLLERVGDEIYSTAVLVGPEGERARYRKAHPIGPERDWCVAGRSRPPVVDLPLGRVGLLLGSDLCFPEIVRALALAGCDLLAVPAGPRLPPVRRLGPTAVPLEPPAVTGEDPVHFHLARVRAIESNCYLAFASLPVPLGIGHSAVCGPTPAFRAGELVLGPDESGVVVREMDTTNLESEYPTCAVRAKDYLKMRQPHLYDLLQVAEPPAL
ncbi:nitrilase/cyanide hydratase and apolipoprotein N-acyltransferase [Thermomicrobiaceae bacterium CFH 74404]|uniref:Nitrilase/cyanide hydratase and apolipoprotein N-acyltransferase n=1 Tax=Thermalbibacter longus TaxID=2951981 RepID=A0AA41WFQ4_9BACT|nr:nitrilase-related carbon-nitrogen hydrolase [Thermalbibacter longus]MCM8749263.1 nitrilase/cyanide hydratase and apolipoprotein N-acyltransferase [Thermalbibacter longus]